MERFVDLSLADIGRTAYRYRPVLAAFAVIVALGLILPGPRRMGEDLARYASGPAATSFPETQSPSEDSAAVVEGGTATDAGVDGTTAALSGSVSAFDAGSRSSSFTSVDSSSRPSGSSASSASSDDSSSSATTATTAAVSTSPSTTSAAKRAAITATLWASRTAGTPLAAEGVPAGGLPIGKRLGQDDKISFLRLSSMPDRIVLAAHADGQRSAETGAIQACLVKTTGWQSGEAVAFDAAPERDCSVAVQGQRSDDGSWSFDLRPFEGRSGDGLALLPAPGAPIDFQVVLQAKLSS